MQKDYHGTVAKLLRCMHAHACNWPSARQIVLVCTVGHKQVQADDGFMMVGAYPQGSPPWDCLEGKGGHSEKQQAESKIQDVPHPGHDPVYGDAVDSPLSQFWKQSDHQQA